MIRVRGLILLYQRIRGHKCVQWNIRSIELCKSLVKTKKVNPFDPSAVFQENMTAEKKSSYFKFHTHEYCLGYTYTCRGTVNNLPKYSVCVDR